MGFQVQRVSGALDSAFASLRSAFPSQAGDEEAAPSARGKPGTGELASERTEVLRILGKWQAAAHSAGEKQAEEECARVVRFIRAVCP